MSARFFGAELKGVVAIIENDVSIYSIFLGCGIYQAYPFFKKREKDIFQPYLNNISSLFILLEVMAFLIACGIFFRGGNVYLVIAIIMMPVAAYIKQLNYVVLIEAPRRRNLSSMIISMSEVVVLTGFMVFARADVYSVIAFYCIAQILNLILSFINLRINPLTIRFSVCRLWDFAKFGFIPMLVYLCMTINYKIDIQMLKWIGSVPYEEIGIYATGVALAGKVWIIPDAIKDILLSKLVKGSKEDEVARMIRINLLICVVAMVCIIFFGRSVVLFLYGSEFEDTYYVMILMLTGVLGMIFYKMVYSYNIAQGKRTVNLVFLGVAAVVNIVGNLILIPIMGIWGAGCMSVISYCICGLCFLLYFHKKSGIKIRDIVFIRKEDILRMTEFIGLTKGR